MTVGIDLEPALLTAVLAGDRPVALTLPPAVARRDDRLLTGRAAAGEPHPDLLAGLGERAMLPLGDTYYQAVDLLAELLDELRRDVGQQAGTRLARAVVAHPADWDEVRRRRLDRAAHAAGFTDVELVTRPEAAAAAPVPGAGPLRPGLLLVLDLGRAESVALLEPSGPRHRLIAFAPLRDRARGAGLSTVQKLLDAAGRRWRDLSDVRAVGSGAVDAERVAGLSAELRGAVRVADTPASAVAAGAARYRRAAAAGSGADAQVGGTGGFGTVVPPLRKDADITERLSRLAVEADGRGDGPTADRARWLAQEIYRFRMRIHPPAPPTAESDVLREATAMLDRAAAAT